MRPARPRANVRIRCLGRGGFQSPWWVTPWMAVKQCCLLIGSEASRVKQREGIKEKKEGPKTGINNATTASEVRHWGIMHVPPWAQAV